MKISNLFNNRLFSFINTKNITQVNTVVLSTEISSQIDLIHSNFFEGKISLSLESITKSKQENSKNPNAVYALLCLETEFYFILKNFSVFKSNLEYLEDNYPELLELKFYELKATYYSYSGNEEAYLLTLKKINKEFGGKIDILFSNLIYLLNSKKFDDAEKEYKKITEKVDYLKKIDFVGGMIYLNLYYEKNQFKYIKESERIFEQYLKENEVDFFETFEIYKASSINLINQYLKGLRNFENKRVLNTKGMIDLIKDDLNHFGEESQIAIKNHYLHCLWMLEEYESYNNEAFKIDEEELDSVNFYFLHVRHKKELDYQKIEKRLESDQILLLPYLETLSYIDDNRFLEHTSLNNDLYNNEVILLMRVDVEIENKKTLCQETIEIVESKRDISLLYFIILLEVEFFRKGFIAETNLENLLVLANEELDEIEVLRILEVLSKGKKTKEYLELALKYKNKYQGVLSRTFKIIEDDKEINFSDFESFINSIEKQEYYIPIANKYLRYSVFSEAYKYYKFAWEEYSFENEDRVEFACKAIQNCVLQAHTKHSNLLDENQNKIYIRYLEENLENISIQQCSILSYYLIVVENNFNGFKYINKKLLERDLNTLSDEEKMTVCPIYFYSMVKIASESAYIDSNLLLRSEDNNLYILKDTFSKNISEFHRFNLLDKINFEIKKRDEKIEKESLFKFIVGTFINTVQSDTFISFTGTEEENMSKIKEILHTNARNQNENFKDYLDGYYIAFYKLTNGRYEDYFSLVHTLYEDEKIPFDAGKCNPTLKNVNKILTLSSIILINHLKLLNIVLEREDIYIQQTTINFLINEIEEYDEKKEIFRIGSTGEELYKDILDEVGIKKRKEYLLNLLTVLINYERIIDDTESVLGLADAEGMISPHIGIQEYKALSYSFTNKWQVITEDKSISFVAEATKYNTNLISNSSFLIIQALKDEYKIMEMYETMYKKNYSFILNEYIVKDTIERMIFDSPIYMLNKNERSLFNIMVFIAEQYNWLGFLDTYYENTFKFKIGMARIPQKNYISSNIEYIKEIGKEYCII